MVAIGRMRALLACSFLLIGCALPENSVPEESSAGSAHSGEPMTLDAMPDLVGLNQSEVQSMFPQLRDVLPQIVTWRGDRSGARGVRLADEEVIAIQYPPAGTDLSLVRDAFVMGDQTSSNEQKERLTGFWDLSKDGSTTSYQYSVLFSDPEPFPQAAHLDGQTFSIGDFGMLHSRGVFDDGIKLFEDLDGLPDHWKDDAPHASNYFSAVAIDVDYTNFREPLHYCVDINLEVGWFSPISDAVWQGCSFEPVGTGEKVGRIWVRFRVIPLHDDNLKETQSLWGSLASGERYMKYQLFTSPVADQINAKKNTQICAVDDPHCR